jgi:hypothetical protein
MVEVPSAVRGHIRSSSSCYWLKFMNLALTENTTYEML